MSRTAPAEAARRYSSGLTKPSGAPRRWLRRATSAAHSGATALVPPITVATPSTSTWYPVAGSASPQTSGTPRPGPPPGLADGGSPAPACQPGGANTALMPPPVAPPPGPSFHTVSSGRPAAATDSRVPPQASTWGDEAGKSTWARPSPTPSPDPASPEAQQTVTPTAPASAKTASKARSACTVQLPSAPPQLIEITDGALARSCTAAVTASRNPCSALGAK